MIKKLPLLALLLLPISASATTTVSGTLQTLGTGTVGQAAFVRFYLRGCGGNQPRVSGTAVIAPSQGGVFFFDMIANSSGVISGTLYSTRDSTGLLGGDITCGTSTTSVWYGMQIFLGGKGGPEIPIHAKNGVSFDISSVTPISTTPVATAPTGDGTYLRLDAGNSPVTGRVTFNGGLSSSGTATFTGVSSSYTGTSFIDGVGTPPSLGTLRLADADDIVFHTSIAPNYQRRGQDQYATDNSFVVKNYDGAFAAPFFTGLGNLFGLAHGAATGVFRMSSVDFIAWINNAGSGDLTLSKNSSDALVWPNPISMTSAQVTTTLVASLPAAAAGNKGWIMTVSDSTSVAAEGQTCVGSSTNTALAFSNGSVWKCF